MAAQSIRVGTGMDLPSRMLWYFGWNRRPLYIAAAALALIGAFAVNSSAGLLFGLIPLALCIRAVQHVREAAPNVVDSAKDAIAKAGAERAGISLDGTDHTVLAAPGSSGRILPPTSYNFSSVYISDAFFAIFAGSSFDLATRSVQLATTAEEIYFRHVSAINQQDGAIEITLTRAGKPKRIPTGNDPNAAALLATLRTKLRTPQSIPPPPPLEPVSLDPPSPITISNSDDERHCYIRASKLMEYYSDPIVIDALIKRLQVPGTVATHRMMTPQDKKAAIEAQIHIFSQTPASFWYRVPPREILAASIWRCGRDFLSERVINDKFYDVAREEDLKRPVARWLQSHGDEPYMEIQLGRRRIDVLGYSKRGPRLTAVELKNSDEEFRRGPDQMGSFAEYAHVVYLACTPAFAADYLERNAEHRAVNHWDPTLLDRKLKQGGFGLLIVERDNVFEVIKPVEQTPSPDRVAKIVSGLPGFHKIDLD